jgi:hypothetical protein
VEKILIILLTLTACAGPAAKSGENSITATGATGTAATGVTGTAAAGVTSTAAAGVTGTAVVAVTTTADEGEIAYNSLTSTADFNYKPAFDAIKYEKNFPIQDIAVSAIEAVPFGFLFTFMSIFLAEAYNQHTLQPQLKTINEYTQVYEIAIAGFAAVNVGVNMLFYYDYKKEGNNAEKTEKKQADR